MVLQHHFSIRHDVCMHISSAAQKCHPYLASSHCGEKHLSSQTGEASSGSSLLALFHYNRVPPQCMWGRHVERKNICAPLLGHSTGCMLPFPSFAATGEKHHPQTVLSHSHGSCGDVTPRPINGLHPVEMDPWQSLTCWRLLKTEGGGAY